MLACCTQRWLRDQSLRIFTLGYQDHHVQRGPSSRGCTGTTLHFVSFSDRNDHTFGLWVVMSVTETVHRREDGEKSTRLSSDSNVAHLLVSMGRLFMERGFLLGVRRFVSCSCSPHHHCQHELLASSLFTELGPGCLGDTMQESSAAARKEMDAYNYLRECLCCRWKG